MILLTLGLPCVLLYRRHSSPGLLDSSLLVQGLSCPSLVKINNHKGEGSYLYVAHPWLDVDSRLATTASADIVGSFSRPSGHQLPLKNFTKYHNKKLQMKIKRKIQSRSTFKAEEFTGKQNIYNSLIYSPPLRAIYYHTDSTM